MEVYQNLNDLDDFDSLLLQAIDQTIRYCLGDVNAQLIYNYLEKKDCPQQDIPKKLDVFVTEFENIVGFGRGQILATAQIIEEAILKAFCTKLEIDCNENNTRYFPEQIKKLKETYNQRNGNFSGTNI
jgi:hypothetical protein